jgi:hypothetical protein
MPQRERLTLLDYSDREFLLLLEDVAEADGWADSEELAVRLDLKTRRSAAQRLSWLARWGAVEKEHARDHTGNLRYHRDGKPMYTQRWRLTDAGRALAYGEIKARQRQALDRFGDEQLLELTRWLTGRTRDGGMATKLALREWKHGHGIR